MTDSEAIMEEAVKTFITLHFCNYYSKIWPNILTFEMVHQEQESDRLFLKYFLEDLSNNLLLFLSFHCSCWVGGAQVLLHREIMEMPRIAWCTGSAIDHCAL